MSSEPAGPGGAGICAPITVCDLDRLRREAYEIRRLVLEMAHQPNGAHLGGALSAADILAVLFHHVLRIDPNYPTWEERDHFILSKGHAAVGLYAALMRRGFLSEEECATYSRDGSRLGGHPSHKLPGIEFTTGSLGHGLSLGLGLALAARIKGRPNRTFVLMGDGELQEGSVYEAAGAAARFDVGALTAIVDRNSLQINGAVEHWLPEGALKSRWQSFGWDVETIDGHDVAALSDALARPTSKVGTPRLFIANTVKAKGVAFMEGNKKSHSVALTDSLYARARADLRNHG